MAIEPTKSPVPSSKAAERDAAQQDGFLREVDEALREEQMVGAIKRYAKPVGGVILAGLLALGGYLAWDYSVKSKAHERSEKAELAFDKLRGGQLDAAAKEYEALAKDGSDGSRAAAAMSLAAIALAQGKDQDAAKRFAALAADQTAPKPYRDLAVIREVSIRFDTMKPDDVVAKLKPLAVPGNPFFGNAGELVAMAYLDMGKPDLAGALFAQIGKDEKAPKSVRVRARQMASGLGYDGGVELPKEEPAAGQPTTTAAPAGAAAPKQ